LRAFSSACAALPTLGISITSDSNRVTQKLRGLQQISRTIEKTVKSESVQQADRRDDHLTTGLRSSPAAKTIAASI